MTDPSVPPEGRLIKAALKRMRLSGREAARRASISETRWHQIVNGYQTVQKQRVAVQAPPETLARMAHTVGVTPEQMEHAGRSDAAAEMRHLMEADLGLEEGAMNPTLEDVIYKALETLPRIQDREAALRRVAERVARDARGRGTQ